jgi:hypothetical protein
MRKLIATVFNYSLNGLLADEGTEFWKLCFDLLDLRGGLEQDKQALDFLQSAYAHIMGRTAYEGMAATPFAGLRPPVGRHPERRAQGRLLPDPEDGRVGQHHHRRRRHGGRDRQAQARRRRLHRGLGRRQPLAVAHAARPDRRVPGVPCTPTLRTRAPGCSTTSPSPTGSTWSPAPPRATGSSSCSTGGTADPAVRRSARRL